MRPCARDIGGLRMLFTGAYGIDPTVQVPVPRQETTPESVQVSLNRDEAEELRDWLTDYLEAGS